MKYIDADKLTAKIDEICDYAHERWDVEKEDGALDFARRLTDFIDSLQQEQPANMIQWTGSNLQEVIDFTGKSPKFGEWFKSWEDFENYVHSHDDILKLFCEDGSHYEVPVGAWIVKTPDGHNVPSIAKYIQQEQPEIKSYIEELLKECAGKDGEYYRGRRETLAHLFAYLGGSPLKYMLQPVKQPEGDLEAEIERYENEIHGFDSVSSSDCRNIARHFAEWGAIHLNAKKEEKK